MTGTNNVKKRSDKQIKFDCYNERESVRKVEEVSFY